MKLVVLLFMVILVACGWWYFFGRRDGAGLPSGGYQPAGGGDSQLSEEQQNAAYDARRKTDLAMINVALAVYKVDHEAYPSNLSQLVEGEYLSSIPKDPKTGEDYAYKKTAPNEYTLSATLSDGSAYTVGP